MKWAVPAVIALSAFAATFGAVFFFTYDGRPKCDAPDVVATVKSLGSQRLHNYDAAQFLLRHAAPVDHVQIASSVMPDSLTLTSFRERGGVGKTGSSCAAEVSVMVNGQIDRAEMSAEYTVEPTTDGKTMVTARFKPNG